MRGEGAGEEEGGWELDKFLCGMDARQQSVLQHEVCVFLLRASTVYVHYVEIIKYFHDLSDTIQHGQETTQNHANDERLTGRWCQERRYDFLHLWTTKMMC